VIGADVQCVFEYKLTTRNTGYKIIGPPNFENPLNPLISVGSKIFSPRVLAVKAKSIY
jgi:hypothetical protein